MKVEIKGRLSTQLSADGSASYALVGFYLNNLIPAEPRLAAGGVQGVSQ